MSYMNKILESIGLEMYHSSFTGTLILWENMTNYQNLWSMDIFYGDIFR